MSALRPRRWLALAAAAALVAPAASLTAQRVPVARPVTTLEVDGGASPSVPIPRSGFKLFANEDLAESGLRMSGDFGWLFPNIGPCDFYFDNGNRAEFCGGTVRQNGSVAQPYFEFNLLAGAPISEFRKIRAVHPGIADMKPPLGYSAIASEYLVSPQERGWGPGDGQFGNLFSGATSTDDGSCRDFNGFRNGQIDGGFTLLAGSDCPDTWPSAGFLGKHPISDQGWRDAFAAQGVNFQWNNWQLPASADDTTRFFGDFATYGVISDHYREILQQYGGVTAASAGPPSERGYPLGLTIRFEGFQYSRPSIRNAAFWMATIINNSEAIYGTGIDYDSLYMGLQPGILLSGDNRAQGSSWYFDFSRGAIIFARGNTSGKCSSTYPKRAPNNTTGGCFGAPGVLDGPTNAIEGVAFLKSPLGDLRNKLFTDPTSDFFNPGSQFVGDTITYNHAMRGGFGNQFNTIFVRSAKSLFGAMAGMEDVFLDGTSPVSFSAANLWRFFGNEDFAGVIDASVAKFNKYAPPGWDYNHDGIQDSIGVPGCGRFGCAALYSDTMPGGYENIVGNVGDVIALGPFALKAGDTTQIIMSVMGAKDSLTFERLLTSVVKSYFDNFAGPAFIPPPNFTVTALPPATSDSGVIAPVPQFVSPVRVIPAAVRDSTDGVQTARIEITIPDQNVQPDKFIQGVVQTLQDTTGPNTQDVRRLERLNPGLLDAVKERINANYARLLIFKSCDNGSTFTIDRSACTPARATTLTGEDVPPFGWQPYQIINTIPGTNELETSQFTDIVQAGRTYLYTFVTQTRGLNDIVVLDSISTPAGSALSETTLGAALGLDADTITSPLSRSGPSTVSVYAPITLPAGTELAHFDTTRTLGSGTESFELTEQSALLPGDYRVIFGNRFIIRTRVDTAAHTSTQTVVAERLLDSSFVGGSLVLDQVASADTISGPGGLFANGLTIPSDTDTLATAADSTGVVFVDTVNSGGIGYLIARISGPTGARALYLSTDLSDVVDEFIGAQSFPGFTLAFPGDNSPRVQVVLRPPQKGQTDTLNADNVSSYGVQLLDDDSDIETPGGTYRVEWSGDAFGPGVPFPFSAVPDSIQPAFDSSLAARPVASTTTVTPELADLVADFVGDPVNDLIAAKLPFTIIGPDGQPVTLALRASDHHSSLLFGTSGDTVRVQVPDDVWVPGDALYVVETIQVDSTIPVVKVDTAGKPHTSNVVVLKDTTLAGGETIKVPLTVPQQTVTFGPMVLGCTSLTSPSRNTCNPLPLGTRASTGYLPYGPGYKIVLDFARDFDLFTELRVNAKPTTVASRAITSREAGRVLVVPNPYVVQSDFDIVDPAGLGTPRIYFTGVPSEGVLRIYSVSGQFLQQLSWTAADLVNANTGVTSGDLPYNLRTREGLDLGTGLYLYVLTAKGPTANGKVIRGKFVVIR